MHLYNLFFKVFLSYILLTMSAFAQTDTLASEISLKTYLENNSVPLNREAVFHVEISWYGDLDLYQISEISDPVVTGLSLRGSGSSNKLISDQGRPKSIRRVTYYYIPQSLGMAYIDGVNIKYNAFNTDKSETLFAQRIGLKIIDPVDDEMNTTISGTFILWVLLIGFILVVSYFLFRYYQRKDDRNKIEQSELTIEEKYLELLKQTIHLSNDANKENVNDLHKLLSSYIAEKFSVPGTIDNKIILDRLSQLKVDESLNDKIKKMLDKFELARFAAEELEISELHAFYDSIESVLMQLKDENKKSEQI